MDQVDLMGDTAVHIVIATCHYRRVGKHDEAKIAKSVEVLGLLSKVC